MKVLNIISAIAIPVIVSVTVIATADEILKYE
jgi:hypothetical protein